MNNGRYPSLFENGRLSLDKAIDISIQSLSEHGQRYRHWVLAFSGGKDSTGLVSLVCHLIATGKVAEPDSLTVLMSDTRQEFTPLHIGAIKTLAAAKKMGAIIKIVEPSLDGRMYVYMLGRGVPPANNKYLRWCTRLLKADPMNEAIAEVSRLAGGEILVLTGVRLGESTIRDQRIALSCARDGGECGQGWFQNAAKPGISATLAPILHWRLCHIEDWLTLFAPGYGFDTQAVCEIYGFGQGDDEAEAMNLRTGCAGCFLITEDKALKRLVSLREWSYQAPLKRLTAVFDELKKPYNRLRKFKEVNKDGKYASRQGRLGPLTMAARRWGLEQILLIQGEINAAARREGRPTMILIDPEEERRIQELWELKTWPQKWDGTEARGDVLLDDIKASGDKLVIQPRLPLEME
jgi:DNA sulfur modification protein DndC